jgi:hypothetical protein
MFSDGFLEIVFLEGYRFLRVAQLEYILPYPASFRDGYDGAPDSERVARLEELREMPYAEYLRSPEWLARRERHLEAAGHRCQLCNAISTLHLHHRTYERRGFESSVDLVVLCAECHRKFHGIEG